MKTISLCDTPTFDIDGAYSRINSAFPNIKERPVVGITANCDDDTEKLAKAYYKSVEMAGECRS